MKFKTISTGSSGNMFLIDDEVAIDCGLPYSKIKDVANTLKYVLLTHIHGDHFNKTTIRKLFINNRDIKFVCGAFLKEHFEKEMLWNVVFVEAGKAYKLKTGHIISPVIAYHDVDNFGYRILKDGHKHFHITDTNSLDGISAKYYNTASIECNHNLETALKIIEEAKEKGEFSHLKGAINSHLSVDKVVEFVRENEIETLYPVHIGSSTCNEVMKYLSNENIKIGE